jgi:hypothetical protein
MNRFIHVCLLAEPFSVWRETLAARKQVTAHMNTVNVILPLSGLLRGLRWFETHVLRLPVFPTFKKEDSLTVEYGTDT